MKHLIKYNEKIKNKKPNIVDAAEKGFSGKIKTYIKNGVDVNMVNYKNETALMKAVQEIYLIIVMDLLKAGADPNIQCRDGKTALMLAKTPKILTLLLNAGADPNIQDNDGDTVIFYTLNNVESLKKLLEKGLDLSIKNNDGNNFYEVQIEQNLSPLIINYIDENFPQYKDEWEMKQNVNRFNI